MPFTLIKGDFVPEAGRPDGDSIRFRPDNPDLVLRLLQRGRPPKVNPNNGTIQLRFEGIDTMESKSSQPFSSDATQSNLTLCGVPSGQGTAPGHVFSNQLGPNGRPIAFVYAGDAPEADGSQIFLDSARMAKSINFRQLELGHAYPLFYDTLFTDLRQALTEITQTTRAGGNNIWSADESQTGSTWGGTASLSNLPPLFPKLWRRLDAYSRDSDIQDSSMLDEFLQYIEFERAERVIIISESRTTGFDNVMDVSGNTVKLTFLPEDLVFMS